MAQFRRFVGLVGLTLCLALGFAAPVQAQEPAGSVQAIYLHGVNESQGGALSADLWYPIGVFRIGGFFGVAASFAEMDPYNRVFMPLGVSLGLEAVGESVGVSFRVRGGLWGGATQDAKLSVGGFFSGMLGLAVRMSPSVALTVGAEVWGIWGDGETLLAGPALGLSWNLDSEASGD